MSRDADRSGPDGADPSTPEPFFDDSVDPFAPPPVPDPPAAPAAAWPPSRYGPPAGWSGGPWPPRYPQPRSTNGFSIAALCCGIAGVITYGVTGVLGVIFGVIALRQLDRDGQAGRWLAIAGIAAGAVTIGLGIATVTWLLNHPNTAGGNFLTG